MGNGPVDPETLAALLDGNLSAEERARVLARLAKSEGDYEALLETAALVGDLSASSTTTAEPPPPVALVRDAAVPPNARKRGWSRPAFVGPAIVAAALALVVVLRTRASRADASLLAVIESASGTDPVPVDWPRTRGTRAIMAPEALSFRVGATFTDLDLAFGAKDSASVRTISSDLADLLAGISGSGATVARVRAIALGGWSGAMSSPNERRKLADNLRALGGKPAWFELGAWTQAARHAAHAGRTQFFQPGGLAVAELDRVLAELEKMPSGNATAIAALERLRRARPIVTRTPVDVGMMSAVLDSIVVEAGR